MAQGLLPFKYVEEKSRSGMTALAGLPTYLELATVAGLSASIDKRVKARIPLSQGWSDRQVVSTQVLLNLAGGDCVDDITRPEGDSGFAELMRRIQTIGMSRKQRRVCLRRLRKEHNASRVDEPQQEYAEIAFVPTWIRNGRKDAPIYRFLAIREPLRQLDLPHIKEQLALPFPRKFLWMPSATHYSVSLPTVWICLVTNSSVGIANVAATAKGACDYEGRSRRWTVSL